MSTHDTSSTFWVSHSSLSEYLKCPLAYYYHHLYKDPQTHHKITLVSPALSLGQAVHDTLESLSTLPTAKRFSTPLSARFERTWDSISGLKGGFANPKEELTYKQRGLAMIQTVSLNPGPLARLAVKLKTELPQYWLSKTDGIILCGRLDWLEYLPDQNALHIIDFKTSKNPEPANSLQLPIYVLLAQHCQPRPVVAASYWYLTLSPMPISVPLPDTKVVSAQILKIAKEMLLKKKLNRLTCPTDGCRYCSPLKAVIDGHATLVGTNNRNQDLYYLPQAGIGEIDSEIL